METYYDLRNLKWRDFSGSPTIFIPETSKKEWMGFYSEIPDSNSSENFPDLEILNKKFYIRTEFDFNNPITDYDKICSVNEVHFPYKLKNGEEAYIIASGSDQVAWWDDEKIFIAGANIIEKKAFQNLKWIHAKIWNVNSENFLLINSCDCPSGSSLDSPNYELITLEIGIYSVQFALYEDGNSCAELFKFIKVQ